MADVIGRYLYTQLVRRRSGEVTEVRHDYEGPRAKTAEAVRSAYERANGGRPLTPRQRRRVARAHAAEVARVMGLTGRRGGRRDR